VAGREKEDEKGEYWEKGNNGKGLVDDLPGETPHTRRNKDSKIRQVINVPKRRKPTRRERSRGKKGVTGNRGRILEEGVFS